MTLNRLAHAAATVLAMTVLSLPASADATAPGDPASDPAALPAAVSPEPAAETPPSADAPAVDPVADPAPPAETPAPHDPPPPTPAQPGGESASPAPDVSETHQTIWQTQVGCMSHCSNTTQAQSASQASATAQSGDRSNASSTVQMVHQTQVGCPTACAVDVTEDPGALAQTVIDAVVAELPADGQGPPEVADAPSQAALTTQLATQIQQALAPTGAPQAADQYQQTAQFAGDVSAVIVQVIVQTQVGCTTHCRGMSQDQYASQASDTMQDGGGRAVTHQFIWQLQIGCIAFCEDTAQVQSASQESVTTQGTAPPGPADVPAPAPEPGAPTPAPAAAPPSPPAHSASAPAAPAPEAGDTPAAMLSAQTLAPVMPPRARAGRVQTRSVPAGQPQGGGRPRSESLLSRSARPAERSSSDAIYPLEWNASPAAQSRVTAIRRHGGRRPAGADQRPRLGRVAPGIADVEPELPLLALAGAMLLLCAGWRAARTR